MFFCQQSDVTGVATLRKSGLSLSVSYARSVTPSAGLKQSWVREAKHLGAKVGFLSYMDAGGSKQGYDLELTRRVSEAVFTPVIASGSADNLGCVVGVLRHGKVAAAAPIFHYGEHTNPQTKTHSAAQGISVRRS